MKSNLVKGQFKSIRKILTIIGIIMGLGVSAGCILDYHIPGRGRIYFGRHIPHIKELRRIEKIPYGNGINSCDKAIMYHQHAMSKGDISEVVSGHINSSPKERNHAWNWIYNPEDNERYTIDATYLGSDSDNEGLRVKDCQDRKVWFVFEDDVTKEDIRKNRRIKEIHWGNLSPTTYERMKKKYPEIHERYLEI